MLPRFSHWNFFYNHRVIYLKMFKVTCTLFMKSSASHVLCPSQDACLLVWVPASGSSRPGSQLSAQKALPVLCPAPPGRDLTELGWSHPVCLCGDPIDSEGDSIDCLRQVLLHYARQLVPGLSSRTWAGILL